MTRTPRSRVRLGILCLAIAACTDQGPGAADAETLRITVELVGIDFPPELTLVVDSTRMPPLQPGQVAVHELPVGRHSVALDLLPRNCTVTGSNPRTLHLVASQPANVEFTVTCTAITGVVETRVAIEGLDAPPSYVLRVDDRPLVTRPATEMLTVMELGGGAHALTLSVSSNCTLAADNPRTVVVMTGGLTRDTARTSFAVSCGAAFGVVESAIEVTGDDIDPTGFTLLVGSSFAIVADTLPATVRASVAAGQHVLRLDRIAANCAVAGDNPRVISVTAGGQTRDTVRTAFAVSCAVAEKIAFAQYDSYGRPWIMVAYADGSDAVRLVEGVAPSWSPDRTKILFTAMDCYDYYYYGCTTAGLATVSTDGKRTVEKLGTSLVDIQGRWSPDGRRLALVRGADIVALTADGFSQTTIVHSATLPGLTRAHEPAWSPDGSRLAFVCQFGDAASALFEICIVNADGSQPARLMSGAWHAGSPEWSPDGATIAFHSRRKIQPVGSEVITIMNPQGGELSTSVEGYGPAWSGDGARILFHRFGAQSGLYSVRRDGTQLTRLTIGKDLDVSWRP